MDCRFIDFRQFVQVAFCGGSSYNRHALSPQKSPMPRRNLKYRRISKFMSCEIFIIAACIAVYFFKPGEVGLSREVVNDEFPALDLTNMEDPIPLELHYLYSSLGMAIAKNEASQRYVRNTFREYLPGEIK